MENLDMQTPDGVEMNIDKIAALFPNCITEDRGEDGNVKRAIDFDLLRQELSGDVVEGVRERYTLNWPGKNEAIATANAPINKTLRPCREESVDFDATGNLYIEGDNLEALKLLQETYLGKVKMIYIDPPYNTGKDFIYSDNFTANQEEYDLLSGQKTNEGGRLVANPESKGRYHSDWLSMMLPRIRLAKNLLSDRGILFMSVDDGEVSNLRKMCDEIFGEDQFAAQIIWKKRNTPPNDKVIGAQHDYILVYVKASLAGINLRKRSVEQIARYKNPDNHPKGPWVAGDLSANVKGGRYVESLNYSITNPRTGQEFYPPNNGNWRFNQVRMQRHLDANEIYFGKADTSSPKLKRFLSEVKSGTTWTTLWDFAPFNTSGTNEMKAIFGNSVLFESPKPAGLIKHMVEAGSDADSIIVDFFSGSASTADAVMQLNAEDKGARKFIMVQLPEACAESSEAYKAGYTTIAEIGKERIRRAGKKIKEENTDTAAGLDTGFRVLKVDDSNMNDVYYTPDQLDQDNVDLFAEHIKEDRTAEDLLFQVMLDWGVPLSAKIEKQTVDGKSVYLVNENDLLACFDKGINEDIVKKLAEHQPMRAVFRDDAFESDSLKINVDQIFKVLSPATEVKSI